MSNMTIIIRRDAADIELDMIGFQSLKDFFFPDKVL